MKIQDSVCVVTGGASGLGRATAEHLLSLGAKVASFDVNPPPERLLDSGLVSYTVDVADDAAVREAIDAVHDRFGAIHVAVNCAGIVRSTPTYGPDGVFPVDLFRRTIDVNLTGTFLVLAYAAEKMALNEPNEEGERGVVVNTASIAGLDASSSVAYAASKGGVIAISLTAARDLASYGIRVNSIAPGFMDTELFANLAPEYTEALEARTVFPKRLGKPSEFARLAAHVIENAYLNATVIRLDSGARA